MLLCNHAKQTQEELEALSEYPELSESSDTVLQRNAHGASPNKTRKQCDFKIGVLHHNFSSKGFATCFQEELKEKKVSLAPAKW